MKTKPTKHKEENTFKFQSFSERLSSINVDIVHRVDLKRNTVPEETETFFFECLEKWSDLNLTEGYTKFCRQLGREVQSLPQLMLHRDDIIDLLYQHIHPDNVLYLEPLLELVVAFAKDFQSSKEKEFIFYFHPKFPDFFNRLVDLLQTKDAQIIEWTFTALAFLYKYLWKELVKDIDNIYKLQLPLLASDKPEYVQLFASESFAFIGRKKSDKPSFVNLVFSKLRANPQDSLGVGQLLFQVVKGVKNQFHSNLDLYLPLYLKAVAQLDGCVKEDPVFLAVEHCFLLMARHTTSMFSTLIWKLLLKEMAPKQPGLLGLLVLLHQWMTFRDGSLIVDPIAIANDLAMLPKENLNDEEQMAAAETIASLMMGNKIKLPLEQFSRLGLLIYSCRWSLNAVFSFSVKVATHELFESHLLPHYLSFCHSVSKMSSSEHEHLLDSLSRLVATKTAFPKSGNEMENYKLYPMEFSFAMRKAQDGRSVPSIVEEVLQRNVKDMTNDQFKLFVSALICLPNLKPVDVEKTKTSLKRIIQEILQLIEIEDSVTEEPKSKRRKTGTKQVDFMEKLGFVASVTILNGGHFFTDLTDMIPLESVLSLLCHELTCRNVFFLRAVDIYLATLHRSGREDMFTFDLMSKLYKNIGDNVSSPYRETRILTLHILSLFTLPLPNPPENANPLPIFDICLQAELIPVGLREHRDKLKCLHDLEAERVVYSLPADGLLNKVPLQYLLSQLFINLRPMWEPILKHIESHAFQMDPMEFWSVYFPFLQRVRQAQIEHVRDPTTEVDYLQMGIASERLDFVHVRSLLWQGLSRFGTVIKKQQSLIVQLFLEFWNEEYCAADGTVAQSQNLARATQEEDGNETDDDEDDENDGDEGGNKCDRKKLIQLLTSHLSVIAAFTNPGQMSQEAEVSSILYRLLTHRSPEVQKQALDCLSAYGYPHLTPYKENLYRLLDDKTFRSELTLFSIDSSSSLVRPEHRSGLTSILMRLLYGKMQNKAGHNAAGKQNIQQRQSLILRYLAGFSEDEIDEFLVLAFQTFHNYRQNDDVYRRVVQLMKEADSAVAHPLKRLQGALVMMGTIYAKLGNLMKSALPKLLQILLCICAHVTGLMEKRSAIDPKFMVQLKNLRTLCLERITQFFTKFEFYPWTASEVEALFHVCVWPQLELLPIEGIHAPTPLLRLIHVWAVNPRYFVLFSKRHPEREELSVLPPMLALLAGGKAKPAVCSFIMDIVNKLVTLADYGTQDADEEGEESQMAEAPVFIEPKFCVERPITEAIEGKEMPNLGSLLLIPHISPVLAYLRGMISRGLNSRDLTVLMRLSEFITDSNLSSELSQLIVPAIKAKSTGGRGQGSAASEEILTQYLNSLTNLLMTASDPHIFLALLAPLFGTVEGRSAREALCNTVRVIGQREALHASLGELVSSLNAWDRKRIDEPDFDVRLKAHKEINAILSKGTPPSTDWVYLVLYNCFHFVRKVNDSSLKDSASYSLQQMAAAFGHLPYGKSVLTQHFLPQLRLLIRSKTEPVRHEGVLLLGETVSHCATLTASLGGLRKLRKAGDAELDFFENSRHIQTHRRSRALLRLTSILKKLKKSDRTAISEESITQFLLPLTTCYLFEKTYDSQNHLVDASFECLQAMSGCLSWYNYDKLLRYFLSQMTRQIEFQKQSVKALVAVLNGFHFDLKNSQFKGNNKPQIETVTENVVLVEVTKEPDAADVVDELPDLEVKEEKTDQSVEAATRIHSIIAQQLLPQLNKILTARSKRDAQHKSVKDHFPEDDEILRVPIALALVHLLKNLPSGALERNLPGMFSKVITFLKSRCDSVREMTRDTLVRMMTALGPDHLLTLLEAAEPILQRGFQVHVYIFTVHAILVKMVEKGQLKVGTVDPVVHHLVQICKKELLGDTADEKEVAQIVRKVKEARGIKAYDTLNIVAKYVSQTSLLQLLIPLKELMASSKSFKLMRKVEECLQNIATGLALNQGLPVEQLLIFIHGVVTLTIPQLKLPEAKAKEAAGGLSANGKPVRNDSFIIAPEPKRKSAVQPVAMAQASKSVYATNSHLFVEFGLLVLQLVSEKDMSRDEKILPMLDPFVPIVNDSLRSQHAKLVSLALRCICRLLRMPLPSIKEYAPKISTSIFTLLHKYSGSASGDTSEMIQTAFKAVTVLVKRVTSHMIDTDQLRILLTYAEQALNDPTQQSIAFGVLKAVIKRKLTLKELPDIMLPVSRLAITSEAGPVRAQCKQVVLQYMIDYPLGKKIQRYLEFFLAQLEYEKEIGRLSAIEFLISVFKEFPKNLLSQQSTLFLVTMSPRFINETSTSCLKALAAGLRILIQRLNTKTNNVLFEICMTWLRDNNLAHKRLAVQLCGIFAAAEGSKFEFRMKELLPEFIQILEPLEKDKEDRDADLLLIQTFYAIIKIAQHCPIALRNPDYVELTDDLWTRIIQQLLHPHLWIRTLSARLVGTLLGWHKVEDVAACVSNQVTSDDVSRSYLIKPDHVAGRLRSLASESVGQLQSGILDDQLAKHVVKNLVFIAKVANRLPPSGAEQELGTTAPTLPWLTGKLRREINAEVALRPNVPIKRVSVFKWMKKVAVDLSKVSGKEALTSMLKFFVPPLTREINDDGAPEEVRKRAQKVAELIKGMVGTEAYSEAVVAASRNLAVRRRDRNAARKADSVIRPERTAQLRIKKHLAKREAKKVKVAKYKGRKLKIKKNCNSIF